jgi:hypothetical protein
MKISADQLLEDSTLYAIYLFSACFPHMDCRWGASRVLSFGSLLNQKTGFFNAFRPHVNLKWRMSKPHGFSPKVRDVLKPGLSTKP